MSKINGNKDPANVIYHLGRRGDKKLNLVARAASVSNRTEPASLIADLAMTYLMMAMAGSLGKVISQNSEARRGMMNV
jgi:hypothetical protein